MLTLHDATVCAQIHRTSGAAVTLAATALDLAAVLATGALAALSLAATVATVPLSPSPPPSPPPPSPSASPPFSAGQIAGIDTLSMSEQTRCTEL